MRDLICAGRRTDILLFKLRYEKIENWLIDPVCLGIAALFEILVAYKGIQGSSGGLVQLSLDRTLVEALMGKNSLQPGKSVASQGQAHPGAGLGRNDHPRGNRSTGRGNRRSRPLA